MAEPISMRLFIWPTRLERNALGKGRVGNSSLVEWDGSATTGHVRARSISMSTSRLDGFRSWRKMIIVLIESGFV
ncbi:hypothetical protein BDZ89DRAFT_1075564 [Hymenopellis radicata]|nr:hypothetical protein BDZ89DRAFT_1075564 [Hymenopellis radicata]